MLASNTAFSYAAVFLHLFFPVPSCALSKISRISMFLCHFPLYNLFEKGSLIVMSSTSVSLISYKCFFPVLVNLKHDFFFFACLH